MAGNAGNNTKPKCVLGFLTVLECPQDGLFGGYLALDPRGRPLEFRCTAPIKPNRAQQILYGSTLNDYLYGEQIGQTLVKGSKHPPTVVFTDQLGVLAVREFLDAPVTLVETAAQSPAEPETSDAATNTRAKKWQIHGAHAADADIYRFHWGRNQLATSADAKDDQSTIADRLAPLADTFDLAEPFVRIREAIDEARSGGC